MVADDSNPIKRVNLAVAIVLTTGVIIHTGHHPDRSQE
jgi:hypothetical protein